MYGFDADETYKECTDKRTEYGTVAQFKVDEIARAYGQGTSKGYKPKQLFGNVEDERKADGRYGCRNGVDKVGVVRHHAELAETFGYGYVFARQHVKGKHDAERHGC